MRGRQNAARASLAVPLPAAVEKFPAALHVAVRALPRCERVPVWAGEGKGKGGGCLPLAQGQHDVRSWPVAECGWDGAAWDAPHRRLCIHMPLPAHTSRPYRLSIPPQFVSFEPPKQMHTVCWPTQLPSLLIQRSYRMPNPNSPPICPPDDGNARPEPEVVRVDPAAGVRAVLPAGYGSGFEDGSTPLLEWMAQVGSP
jgi:hypothetical protein